jgi:hypothetical protein
VVLSLSESDKIKTGIPESARVQEGPSDTTDYTMALFNLGSGTGTRTWGDLLRGVQGTKAEWRKELDSHFLLALKEELFSPIESLMRSGGRSRVGERFYRPILYSISRGPPVGPVSHGAAGTSLRPRAVTIILTPEPLAEGRGPQPPAENAARTESTHRAGGNRPRPRSKRVGKSGRST